MFIMYNVHVQVQCDYWEEEKEQMQSQILALKEQLKTLHFELEKLPATRPRASTAKVC